MKKNIFAAPLLALLVLLASCSPVAKPTNTPVPEIPTQVQVAATVAPQPSATPQASKVILVAGPSGNGVEMQSLLTELSAPSGLTVEMRPSLQPAEVTADVKIVLMLATPGNLAEFTAAAPQVQFVIVSQVDQQPSANLSVIRERAENQAFLAGFISTLLSIDYRAAGLLPSDGPLAGMLQEVYINGGRYFCGVCAPGWPLGVKYPLVAALPSASDGPTWQASAADLFDNQKAEVFFIAPEAARPEVISYLQGKVQIDRTVLVIGTQPPLEGLQEQWAASVRFDDQTTLRQLWPDISAGKGGALVDAPLVVDNVNTNLLGSGRMRLVEELLEEIKAGRVTPYSVAP